MNNENAKPLTGVPCEYRHNPPDLACSWCLHLEAEAAGPLRAALEEAQRERDAAIRRAEGAEADRDRWKKVVAPKLTKERDEARAQLAAVTEEREHLAKMESRSEARMCALGASVRRKNRNTGRS